MQDRRPNASTIVLSSSHSAKYNANVFVQATYRRNGTCESTCEDGTICRLLCWPTRGIVIDGGATFDAPYIRWMFNASDGTGDDFSGKWCWWRYLACDCTRFSINVVIGLLVVPGKLAGELWIMEFFVEEVRDEWRSFFMLCVIHNCEGESWTEICFAHQILYWVYFGCLSCFSQICKYS